MIEWVLKAYGHLGLFIVALISNAIPYSTIPYLIIVAPLLSSLRGADFVLAALSLALGATLGKVLVYLIGRGLTRIGRVNRALHGLKDLASSHSRALFIMVFLAAATPIPDDVLYIPMGLSEYSILLFATAVFLGKVVITLLAALYGVALKFFIEEVANVPSAVQIPLMIAITMILVVVSNSIDWVGVRDVYREKGLVHAFAHLLASIPKGVKKMFK